MSQASIVSTRHKLWLAATYIGDFDVVPPFSARTLSELAPGEVRFRAERSVGLDDQVELVTLDVSELWLPGPDPLRDHRLESEGCHISVLRWHVQVSAAPAERFAERLDVVPGPDPQHPRIHRHPFGEPNYVRVDANFDPPSVWLALTCRMLPACVRPETDIWDPEQEE